MTPYFDTKSCEVDNKTLESPASLLQVHSARGSMFYEVEQHRRQQSRDNPISYAHLVLDYRMICKYNGK
uniref:Uncharacterized protein n=1 Tax=Arundo donax TaxID=35708 RepID=A0A0A9T7Y5_ARUDO